MTEEETKKPENEQEIEKQEIEEDDDSLPFPRARIVKLMKEQIGSDKQIRSEVKEAVNIWLGDILKKVSKEMGGTQFGSVGIADFQRATNPYNMLSDILKDEERIRVSVDKLRSDADHIMREFDRFFEVVRGK